MFVALKTCFYLIFSNIKMYSLLNLIINKKFQKNNKKIKKFCSSMNVFYQSNWTFIN